MANRTLVNSYLRSARAAHPTSPESRLAWLAEAAAVLDAAIQSGDWEVTAASFSGASNSSRRNITASDRLAAIEEATRLLEGDPATTRKAGGFIIPRFPDLYRPD